MTDVPRHGGSLWTTYDLQQGALQGLILGAGVVARGQREGNTASDFQLPGYATVNLLAGYEWKVGPSRISAQFNVENLLDKTYFENSSANTRQAYYGVPRTFLGSVRVEF